MTPEFGAEVLRRADPCTPRELFCNLFVSLEDHVHFFEPAFELVTSLLALSSDAAAPEVSADSFAGALAASSAAEPLVIDRDRIASSWLLRVVRELGPLGLSDGAWLRGWVQVNMVESEVGMRALEQLMLRLGDPSSSEGYALRFAALLQSVGIPPDSISRWEWDESAPCTDLSYEQALLGLGLGLFPSSFGLETLGFNLWMASIGPCPLLQQLRPDLHARGADLRYLDRYDRPALTSSASRAIAHALHESDTAERRQRIARGFWAAERAYRRWEQAMLGRNIPFTPRDFVLEGMRRKARFAADHHRDVRLAKSNIAALLQEGGRGHELLLDKLAASALVRRGAPDQSRLITHSITIEGPMFDAFTSQEKTDLREWIASLGLPGGDTLAARGEPLPLAGRYIPPRDPDSLREFAHERYGDLDNRELYFCFANADCHPASIVYARAFVQDALDQLYQALDGDERLNSMSAPPYSERYAAQMVAAQHDKNVRSRNAPEPDAEQPSSSGGLSNPIAAIFDGCWLQGFTDVRTAAFEEHGWLFRIYASEHGDGKLDWNHDLIFRKALPELGPCVMLPKTDQRLYDLFAIGVGSVATLAVSLNTKSFLPEILGLNLGIEATGVGGEYMDAWKTAAGEGAEWKALAARLHNSIDNYADGHTKWSLAAVQAFMRRVKEAAPSQLEPSWQRVWRLWRCQDIFTHGTAQEKKALAEHFGVTSLAPTG